mgnify:CR=1 FL=1
MAASATRRESVHDLMDRLRRDPDWEVRRGAAMRLAATGYSDLEFDLAPDARAAGATFARFGLCTTWIDGNSVTAFFDDLQFTYAP